MSEAWIMELLGSLRDVARKESMPRLAEQLDDAILIAASELHEAALVARGDALHGDHGRETVRDTAARGLH